ncbi:MAG: Methyltransferase type 11 [Candidatus Uhrbacteria bacterium GW2011_GWA2_52_8d]|uniref:Methyltransferase type 11 n=1 Tax=Candidatus Uhrbacteria bacterium GW2011_GWA2_52_8d TaxID=1618979 RepID=A0A0G1ZU87_9BACT|nr:MAG: Methyltransferase type 11 [Candidatus Uhrbacteria bacterium GW2011_GWA2_52_8d]
MTKIEFSGERSSLYKQALNDYPSARTMDLEMMTRYLHPSPEEVILEIGAGSGFFSGHIADALKPTGHLLVSDPSEEQLEEVLNLRRSNIEIVEAGAHELTSVDDSKFDAVWSFGAIHHAFKKTEAFSHFYRVLKPGGRLIIVDVLTGSDLAKHFDSQVAKFCVVGHEVAFMSREYMRTLSEVAGFEQIEIVDLPIQWLFKSKEDVGDFLYKLHAMTKTTREECLRGAEEILGIEELHGQFLLNWPLSVLVCNKPL